jgi:hypothetical protein
MTVLSITLSLSLMEEMKLRSFENRALKRILGLNRKVEKENNKKQ